MFSEDRLGHFVEHRLRLARVELGSSWVTDFFIHELLGGGSMQSCS
jgi:hypothetical protein